MWLMGVNSYDEDIKFQSSDRPQFLTHTKCQRVQPQSTRFCLQRIKPNNCTRGRTERSDVFAMTKAASL